MGNLFPGKGEKCLKCAKRAQREGYYAGKYAPLGDKLFNEFLDQVDARQLLRWDYHVELRSSEKLFNPQELFDIIVEGWAINFYRKSNTVLVLAYKKMGSGRYLAYHVPLIIQKHWNGKYTAFAKTVYFPQVSAHLWNPTFDKRVCWCQPYDMGEAGVL